ncbi:MAG: sugar transferase [Actinomycetota bacterium]
METRRVIGDSPEHETGDSQDQSLRIVHSEGDTPVVTTVDNIDEVGRSETIVLETESAGTGERRSLTALKKYSLIGFGLAVSDLVCVILAMLAARASSSLGEGTSAVYTIASVLAVLVWAPVFYAFGLHSIQRLSPSEEFRRVIGACSLGVLLVVLLSYWSKSDLARSFVATSWILVLLFELSSRRVWRYVIGRLRAQGRLTLRTVIVGANDEAHRVSETLKRRGLGFAALGYVGRRRGDTSSNGLPMLGNLDALTNVIKRNSVDCLFVASTAVNPEEMMKVVQASRQTGVTVRVSANLPQILTTRLSVQAVSGDLMAISLKPAHLTPTQAAMKRTFDIVVAALGLAVLSPLLLVTTIAVKTTSRGPALFRQKRVTKGGRSFVVYKYRTMAHRADLQFGEETPDQTAAFFKIQDDPRLTKVGRLLRRLSIDELPQLWNVIKGDMSLVGPRPLPLEQVEANPELLTPRHEVKAGMTGWWQVNGRSDLSPEKAVRLDLFYIENWSLSLDLFVVLKTVGVLLARRGAY